MTIQAVAVDSSMTIGADQPLALIAGPCAIESRDLARQVAEQTAGIARRLGMPYIFKSSFDKANRSSVESYRGPGMEEGLEILREIGSDFRLPVLTDIHLPEQAATVAEAVDVLQIPAFLCRQTDLLLAAGRTGRTVNVKKGQFLSPWDTVNIVEKLRSTGNEKVLLTERGVSFGYQNLVVDMKSIPAMRQQAPVVFDATHSVQQPGGLGKATGGQREYIPALARAAVAAGADAVFLEVHPNPESALSDGPNMLPLAELEELLKCLQDIAAAIGRPRRL